MGVNSAELHEVVKLSLQYAKESSERVRKVVVLLIVASVVTFIAWWNQYEHSWTSVRITTAQNAMQYLCEEEKNKKGGGDPEWLKDCASARRQDHLSKRDEERSREFLNDWKFNNRQLERHIQDLQDQYVAGVLKINVPFFGLTSDINDLGILSGIALVALVVLFIFAIWREEQNVNQLFATAIQYNVIDEVVKLFAMTQVFTIPPWHKEPGARRVTAVIYTLPVSAYCLVISYDVWQTFTKPKYYRLPQDWLTLGVETCALLVLLAMRFVVVHITRRLAIAWKEVSSTKRIEADAQEPNVQKQTGAAR